MISLFFYLLFLFSVIYSGFLLWVFIGWKRIVQPLYNGDGGRTRVSVIIPVRNEEQHIEATLSDLVNQKYPSELYEIIVVNDHSTDSTVSIINKFIQEIILSNKADITLLDLELTSGENSFFKKNAITEAIRISEGELIITTDADCRRSDKWLLSIARIYETNRSSMISSPVMFNHETNWFEKIQSLEFMGLIAIGAGCISNKQPMLSNGANLAFSKDVFCKVDGYNEKGNVASGDDTQLLRKIAALDKNRIHFLKSHEAIVTTEAKGSWKEMFNQRKRWASKIPAHMNGMALFIGVIAYFLHLGLLLGLILSILGLLSKWFIIAFSLKILSEFLLLNSIAAFMKKQNLLWLLLPAQLYYMTYIVVVGVASVFGKYEWKGRRIK